MTGVNFFLLTLISFILSVAGVSAADLALIIGNRNYQRATTMYSAEAALNSGTALRREGYFVISGRDVTQSQTRQALGVMHEKISSSGQVIVMLNGHFVHSDTDTWFVPTDARDITLANINYDGLSLATLLDILAAKPGQAAVFLGTYPRDISVGAGLVAGIGNLTIPQGVFVATGKPDDIDLTFRRDFLTEGVGLADALARAPESVSGAGFISNAISLAPGGLRGDDGTAIQEGYWKAVNDMGTVAALRTYLDVYPEGTYASEAQSRIEALRNRTDEERAKQAEEDLDLSRDERRKLQENLTLLGFDTKGIDGLFGRGTRSAIAAWQKQQGMPDTGFFKRRQIEVLANQAARRADQLAREAAEKQRALEREDREFWVSSGAKAGEVRGLRRYLKQYPDGLYADIAQNRLDVIREENRSKIGARERVSWERAEADNSLNGYREYLNRYPTGSFADEATARIEKLQKEEQNRAGLAEAEAEENSMQMNFLARILVEKQLLVLGFESGAPDGNFDKNTRKALRQFQRSRGFPVSGFLTRQTLVRLIAEAQGKQ